MVPALLVGLVGLVTIAVVIGVAALRRARKVHALRARFGEGAVPEVALVRWQTLIPSVLLLGAVVSLALAVSGFSVNRQVKEGTVILVIDVSNSMLATDVQPNRLEAARAAAEAFLQKVPAGFRVGIVTFAGQASVLVAPTADHAAVVQALGSLPAPSEGTTIGDGLTSAIEAIGTDQQQHGGGPAAVVVLTDGLDTGSQVPPLQAANRAQSLRIPVFTVAIGEASQTTGGANTTLLAQLAKTTGAKTFTAQSASELTQVYTSLGSRLSYDLAVGGSGVLFVVLAGVLALAAGISLILITRSS